MKYKSKSETCLSECVDRVGDQHRPIHGCDECETVILEAVHHRIEQVDFLLPEEEEVDDEGVDDLQDRADDQYGDGEAQGSPLLSEGVVHPWDVRHRQEGHSEGDGRRQDDKAADTKIQLN